MSRWVTLTATVALLGGAIAAGLVGCTGDPSNDPYLTGKFTEIDSELRKVSELTTRVQDLVDDLDQLEGDILDIKKKMRAPTAAPAATKKLNDRLAALENRLKRLESTVQGLGKRVAARSKPSPLPLRIKPPTAKSATSVAKPPAPVAKPPAPRGKYYTAVKGDTIKSVAEKFNITVGELCKANTYLKPDSILMPGQRYWIPQK